MEFFLSKLQLLLHKTLERLRLEIQNVPTSPPPLLFFFRGNEEKKLSAQMKLRNYPLMEAVRVHNLQFYFASLRGEEKKCFEGEFEINFGIYRVLKGVITGEVGQLGLEVLATIAIN